MCGFCGIYQKNTDNQQLIRRMCAVLQHRGPDDSGTYSGEDFCLGHNRLSIIDLVSGNQPIFNEDKSLVIIYNGEIYNYREIRERLRDKGHSFQTQSDTEVILKLYQDAGPEAFAELNGIFALAILDKREKPTKLILARDHFGIKPLHYFYQNGLFIFASEQKAILLHPSVKRELNPAALHIHLNLRYTQSEETLFKSVYRLPPGHYLVFRDAKIEKVVPYRRAKPQINSLKSEDEWLAEIPVYLKEAVRRQLVSDVPIGVYLSGGMDSSSIVAMMREAGVEKISTFTLGFNEPTDELDDAQLIARHFQTDHHTLRMEMNPLQMLPEVIWHAEEPKINLLQGFYMSQFVSSHVKVVLGGLGGDELFSGYDIHRYIYPFNNLHKTVPRGLEQAVLARMSTGIFNLQQKLSPLTFDEYRRGLQMLLATGNIMKFYLILRNVWDYDLPLLKRIYGPKMLQNYLPPVENLFRPLFEEATGLEPIDQVYFVEMYSKMVNDYLLTEDRMSMSHSVEERVPFLDKDLVEFALSIPASLKMKGNRTKYLLRKAMAPYLPEEILRKKKQGFTFNPYLQFKKDLKTAAERVLTRERIERDGLFNYDYIREILQTRPHPKLRWHYNFIWVLTGFYIWKDMFIDSNKFETKEVDPESYYGK